MPGNLISGPEWLDEVEICSDFWKELEVFPGFLNLSPADLPPSKGSADRIRRAHGLGEENLHRYFHEAGISTIYRGSINNTCDSVPEGDCRQSRSCYRHLPVPSVLISSSKSWSLFDPLLDPLV